MTPRPGEPAWTEDDLEYVLEWQRMQDALCSGCGQPRDESFDPDYADAYEPKVLRCHACATAGRAADLSRKTFDGDVHGLYTSVSKAAHLHD